MIFLNNCCLNIVVSQSYFVIAIIVFSLVDKRAGFSNAEVMGSNPGVTVSFFPGERIGRPIFTPGNKLTSQFLPRGKN